LEPLARDGDLLEVVVIDDESTDGTAELARSNGARVLAGRPLPDGWKGKAWALQQGLEEARGDWVVFLDADTRPQPGLARALVGAAAELDLLSAGPRFVCETAAERLLHPALLATLVMRFGPTDVEGWQPSPSRAIANGQCVAVRREQFAAAGGWGRVRHNLTEDAAIARSLRRDGWRVGFVDATELLEVRMYESARETWTGWGRSLAMPDATDPLNQASDVAVVWLCQAAPLLRVALGRSGRLDRLLLAVRLALHAGFARSYRPRGIAFWLAPLMDAVAALRLTLSALRPAQSWRGRSYPSSARPSAARTAAR
jgi:dolichol-phosphate mannosyltransferase